MQGVPKNFGEGSLARMRYHDFKCRTGFWESTQHDDNHSIPMSSMVRTVGTFTSLPCDRISTKYRTKYDRTEIDEALRAELLYPELAAHMRE